MRRSPWHVQCGDRGPKSLVGVLGFHLVCGVRQASFAEGLSLRSNRLGTPAGEGEW